MAPIYAVAFLLLTILGVGLVGSTRRLGFWLAVLAAVVLTPVGGLIVAVLSGRPRLEPARRPAKSDPAPAS